MMRRHLRLQMESQIREAGSKLFKKIIGNVPTGKQKYERMQRQQKIKFLQFVALFKDAAENLQFVDAKNQIFTNKSEKRKSIRETKINKMKNGK